MNKRQTGLRYRDVRSELTPIGPTSHFNESLPPHRLGLLVKLVLVVTCCGGVWYLRQTALDSQAIDSAREQGVRSSEALLGKWAGVGETSPLSLEFDRSGQFTLTRTGPHVTPRDPHTQEVHYFGLYRLRETGFVEISGLNGPHYQSQNEPLREIPTFQLMVLTKEQRLVLREPGNPNPVEPERVWQGLPEPFRIGEREFPPREEVLEFQRPSFDQG